MIKRWTHEKYTTVVIDRDGTIGGDGHQPVDEFPIYSYSIAAITRLKSSGLHVYALTNQTHIANGDMDDQELFDSLIDMDFDDAFICTHTAESNCHCRKPAQGLILRAQHKYAFDNQQTIIIGDRVSTDMRRAAACHMLGIYVTTGKNELCDPLVKPEFSNTFIKVNNLSSAADYILDHL